MTSLLACGLAVAAAVRASEFDVTLADFPRQAGETDDAARLQRAVDATGHGGVLYLPKGLYEASRTVWVTNGASLLLHKSATVRATAKTVLDIGPDWRELRIPFGALRYFSQWPHVPPFKEGVAPDARKMVVARFMYGNWISGGTADQAHGFEIESFRIVGR